MTIHELAEQAGYFLPTGVAEKELRHEATAVSASSVNARIILVSELIKARTHIELFWDEVVAFERGVKLRTLLEKRVATWRDIAKPVVGRSSKRSYAPLPKKTEARDSCGTAARLDAAWERVRAKEIQTAAPPPAIITASPQPSDPALKSIDEKLGAMTAMKALEMQPKMREMGEEFRDSLL